MASSPRPRQIAVAVLIASLSWIGATDSSQATGSEEAEVSYTSPFPLPQARIGQDDRTRVTPTTNSFKRAAVAALNYNTPNGSPKLCTAWLYDPSAVVTAGHCMYNRNPNDGAIGYNSNFVIFSGRDASSQPYPSCGVTTGSVPDGWAFNGNRDYDYGVLVLDCNVGNATGWFGFYPPSGAIDEKRARLPGYPNPVPFNGPAYSQWNDLHRIKQVQPRQLLHNIDATKGQSGGPLWRSPPSCDGCAIGVHAYSPYGGSPYNRLFLPAVGVGDSR